MTRASLTVHMKNGINYDAALVMPSFEDGTMRPMLSFLCSGRMQTVVASDVETITFFACGISYCGVCEQPLDQHILQSL